MKTITINNELNDDWIRNVEGYDDDKITKKAFKKPIKVHLKGGPGSGDFGHRGRPGQIGGSSDSSSNYLPKDQRVWNGKQSSEKRTLSKLKTGEIGEQVAIRAMSKYLGAEFSSINTIGNNAPIDIAGNHHAIEVKTGLSSNGKSAQQWRATIGQPGKQEAKLLKQMSPSEKEEYNNYKQEQILIRKNNMLQKMSQMAGTTIKPAVVGVILSPNGKKADVFFIPDFHLRLGWNKYAVEEYYIGSYDVNTSIEKQLIIRTKGGPGSGFYGHKGRVGMVGGSSSNSNIHMLSPEEIDTLYYHRSTSAEDTNKILQSGYIKGKEDNFAPRIYRGYRNPIGDKPVVFFGVIKSRLKNFYTTMTTNVASNLTNTNLSDDGVHVLIFNPKDGGYYDVSDLYKQGATTQEELIELYDKYYE